MRILAQSTVQDKVFAHLARIRRHHLRRLSVSRPCRRHGSTGGGDGARVDTSYRRVKREAAGDGGQPWQGIWGNGIGASAILILSIKNLGLLNEGAGISPSGVFSLYHNLGSTSEVRRAVLS
jgi:hypothetical protein